MYMIICIYTGQTDWLNASQYRWLINIVLINSCSSWLNHNEWQLNNLIT
jgi:hypothetical protein